MNLLFLVLVMSLISINMAVLTKEMLLKAVSDKFRLPKFELSQIDLVVQKHADEFRATFVDPVDDYKFEHVGETQTIVLPYVYYYEQSWDDSMKVFLEKLAPLVAGGTFNSNAYGNKLFGIGFAMVFFEIEGRKRCQYIITTGRATSKPYTVEVGTISKKYTVLDALQLGPQGDVLLVTGEDKEEVVMKTAGPTLPHLLKNELGASDFLKKWIQDKWTSWEALTQKVENKYPKVVYSEVIALGSMIPSRANESDKVLLLKKQNGQDLLDPALYNYAKFTIIQLLRICRQIWLAIAFLHINDITHGDIKPDNFIYDINGDENIWQLAMLDYALSVYLGSVPKRNSDPIGSLLWEYITPYQHNKIPGAQEPLKARKLIDIGSCAFTIFVVCGNRQDLPWKLTVDEFVNIQKDRKAKEDEIIQKKLNFFSSDEESSNNEPTELKDIMQYIKKLVRVDVDTTQDNYKEALHLFDVKIQELMNQGQ